MSSPTTITASAPAARVEVRREGPPKPWLGQLVPIEVDVWRPTNGTRLEPFSLDDVTAAGMIAKWSEQAPPPDEKQEGDVRFLVQHRTLLLFPQSDGELVVPSLVARWTDPATKVLVAARSPELHFEAAIPPGSADTLPLVASSVVLEQSFDRELSGLRVGDGFTRTLTLRARDSDPIVFPELSLAEATGLTAYPGVVRAQSSTERGQDQASETLRVTYVVDRVGWHSLEGLSVRWLEPQSGRYLEARVPSATFLSGPNPSLGFQCLGTARGAALATGFGSLGALALLGVAIFRRIRRGPGRFERALKRRSRERRSFRELLRSARHEPALVVLQKLYTWLAVRFPDGLDRTLTPLASASPDARKACDDFEREVFCTKNQEPPARSFVTMLRHARAAMGRTRRNVALEGLNPGSRTRGESS